MVPQALLSARQVSMAVERGIMRRPCAPVQASYYDPSAGSTGKAISGRLLSKFTSTDEGGGNTGEDIWREIKHRCGSAAGSNHGRLCLAPWLEAGLPLVCTVIYVHPGVMVGCRKGWRAGDTFCVGK